MKEQTIKKCTIASIIVAGLGLVCFLVKLIESFTREAHKWAKTFVIVGFVFVGVALIILIVTMIMGNQFEKKDSKIEKKSDEELLAKYKSKK